MKPIFTTLLLLTSIFSFGQKKTDNSVSEVSTYNSIWYSFTLDNAKKLSLTPVATALKKKYYRVWDPNTIIDIWVESDGTLAGELIYWVYEYVPEGEKPTYRTFKKTIQLSAKTVKSVNTLFESSGMLNLQSDDSIKNWKIGDDGVTYIIESLVEEKYTFKTYWTPKAQKNLKEAKQVQSFIEQLFRLVNEKSNREKFEKEVPYECFFSGMIILCNNVTSEQKIAFKKERSDYRRKMHLN